MKTTIDINGEPVEITLTKEQIAQIIRKTSTYTDIKTVKDAFEFLGLDYAKWLKDNSNLSDHTRAYEELTYIAKALNGGEWMDYSDTSINKYYPYFYSSGSGAGFTFLGYLCAYSYSYVGSRLCFKSSEIATYAGNQFLDIYNKYIN